MPPQAEVDGIVLEHVQKTFQRMDRPAVAGVSARIASGRITGLVGPDGAGKTTLLRMIAGLLLPSDGAIRVAGYDPSVDAAALRDSLGYMPQKFGLYEDLSVQE
ncbi:MAG: ATP-binding cassette domain-containing protein, partial [Steroidobacteraceae bacterium]